MVNSAESGKRLLGASCRWLQEQINRELEMVDSGEITDLSDEGSRMVEAQTVLIPLLSRIRVPETREQSEAPDEQVELLVEALRAIVAKEPAVQKFDAQLLADGFAMGAILLDKGDRSFNAYTEVMALALGDRIKPYLRSCYEAVRHYPRFDYTGMSDEATCAQEFRRILAEAD